MTVALELQHGIDYMLEHLRARYAPLLVYMTYQDDGHVAFLGISQQPRGTFANLTHASGGRLDFVAGYGLDGIDYNQTGLRLLDILKNVLKRRLAGYEHVVAEPADTVGAHLELGRAFLAGDIENAARADGENVLEHEGGFADAGLSAHKHEGTGHETSSEHAVKLARRQKNALLAHRGNLRDLAGTTFCGTGKG